MSAPERDGAPIPPDPPPETPEPGPEEPPGGEKVMVKLGDGREREIRSIAATTCWSHDGRPLTAQEFMEQLFGDLSGLVASEDELRAVWSDLQRREGFVQRLSELGYDADRMNDMHRLIDAPDSGASHHRKPLRSKKIMPLNTRLSSTRGLPVRQEIDPPDRFLIFLTFGK